MIRNHWNSEILTSVGTWYIYQIRNFFIIGYLCDIDNTIYIYIYIYNIYIYIYMYVYIIRWEMKALSFDT